MKTQFNLLSVAAAVALAASLFTTGCQNGKSLLSPAVVQQGVATGVRYSVTKYPTAVPYIKAAAPFVCAAANSTNISPPEVIAAIEASNTNVLKTPEAVLILNSALTLYIGVWNGYGSNALANVPELQTYLKATCDGINDGLSTVNTVSAATTARSRDWPTIKF